MLIVGAKGLAKEIVECLTEEQKNSLVFYDDVNAHIPDFLFDKFPILKTEKSAKNYFKETNNAFVIGVGNPQNRHMLSNKFEKLGGVPQTIVHKDVSIGGFDNVIRDGTVICPGTRITNSIIIENGVLLNLNVSIGHDSIIGEYSELCPNVNISGHCQLGQKVFVGTGAVILPEISIGDEAIIGAGAVVTKDVKPSAIVVGNPAKVI